MTDEPPVVDVSSVNKSRTDSLDCSAVTDNSNMPLTPKNSKYEPLKSLSDIRSTRDLTEDSVREILRRYTKDCLELVSMGSLEDMSGLNDAFNRYRPFNFEVIKPNLIFFSKISPSHQF